MFIDYANITVTAGNGGNGLVSFRREKYVPAGGPDGGDGGDGGSVILIADSALTTLMDFNYKRHYKAQNGEDGRARRCSGKKGDDLVVTVPCGTVIRCNDTVVADLNVHGERYVAARGGSGGWGNSHFATPMRQAPKFAKNGTKGTTADITLELKLLADVGLAGFPNVGKSTLLASCTKAQPKIADYHFTTLKPNLGVVSRGEGRSFVMADIPGLIEGAHDGAGLGHEFLRHLERTRLIIHVIDCSLQGGTCLIDNYKMLNNELALYSEKLFQREQFVALNKCDIGDDNLIDEFCDYAQEHNITVFKISCATTQGISELLDYAEARLAVIPQPQKLVVEQQTELQSDLEFKIELKDGHYRVSGDYIDKLAGGINFADIESLQYFQRCLKRRGVIDGLRAAGAKEGDSVLIGDMEFDFIE